MITQDTRSHKQVLVFRDGLRKLTQSRRHVDYSLIRVPRASPANSRSIGREIPTRYFSLPPPPWDLPSPASYSSQPVSSPSCVSKKGSCYQKKVFPEQAEVRNTGGVGVGVAENPTSKTGQMRLKRRKKNFPRCGESYEIQEGKKMKTAQLILPVL